MADYTVESSHVGVGAWTMTADTVDTVTFADQLGTVRVVSDGAAEVYYTINGDDPTVPSAGESTNCLRMPATASVSEVDVREAGAVIKLISDGTPKVSVEAAL